MPCPHHTMLLSLVLTGALPAPQATPAAPAPAPAPASIAPFALMPLSSPLPGPRLA